MIVFFVFYCLLCILCILCILYMYPLYSVTILCVLCILRTVFSVFYVFYAFYAFYVFFILFAVQHKPPAESDAAAPASFSLHFGMLFTSLCRSVHTETMPRVCLHYSRIVDRPLDF